MRIFPSWFIRKLWLWAGWSARQKPDDGHNEQGNVFLMNLFCKRKRSAFQFISFPLPPLSPCSTWNLGIFNRDEFRLFSWWAKCASPFSSMFVPWENNLSLQLIPFLKVVVSSVRIMQRHNGHMTLNFQFTKYPRKGKNKMLFCHLFGSTKFKLWCLSMFFCFGMVYEIWIPIRACF